MRKFWPCLSLLSLMMAPLHIAHADFQSDVQGPMALVEQKKYAQAASDLEALLPRYPDEFLLHFLYGTALLGRIGDTEDITANVTIARQSRAAFLRAQKLAGQNKEAQENVASMIGATEEILRTLGAPLDAPTATNNANEKDTEIAALKARLAELEAQKNAPVVNTPVAAPRLTNPQLPPLAPRPGYIIGRCVDMRGKPLAGVEVHVSGTTLQGGEKTSYDTKTGADGKYAIQLPPGNFHLGRVNYPTHAPSGPPYALPLYPLSGNRDDQNSRPGIVADCVLKISGLISPQKDRDNDLSYYGGFISVEGGTLENGNFLDGYNYRFPAGSAVELTLVPQGQLADGSTGQTLVLRQPVARGYIAEFLDVPLGAYQVTARLIDAEGKASPLRIAAAKFFSGTSPAAKSVELADFGQSARLYFPSRGDSIPLLTYGGAAKAPLYVKP